MDYILYTFIIYTHMAIRSYLQIYFRDNSTGNSFYNKRGIKPDCGYILC